MTSVPPRRRPPLRATVLRMAAVATVAAVLVWSLLYIELVRNHAATSTALAQPDGRMAAPDSTVPAPVTTRTS